MYQSVLTLLQQHLCASSPTTPTSPAVGSLASAFAASMLTGGRSPSPSSGGESTSRNPSPALPGMGASKLGPPTPTGGLASPLGGAQNSQQLYSKLLLTLPSLYALEREQLRRLFCVALETDVDVLLANALNELSSPSPSS